MKLSSTHLQISSNSTVPSSKIETQFPLLM